MHAIVRRTLRSWPRRSSPRSSQPRSAPPRSAPPRSRLPSRPLISRPNPVARCRRTPRPDPQCRQPGRVGAQSATAMRPHVRLCRRRHLHIGERRDRPSREPADAADGHLSRRDVRAQVHVWGKYSNALLTITAAPGRSATIRLGAVRWEDVSRFDHTGGTTGGRGEHHRLSGHPGRRDDHHRLPLDRPDVHSFGHPRRGPPRRPAHVGLLPPR